MKIKRFGKEIELTDEELKMAHEEYQNELDMSDVRAYVEKDIIFAALSCEQQQSFVEEISAIADHYYRHNMPWEEAILTTISEYREDIYTDYVESTLKQDESFDLSEGEFEDAVCEIVDIMTEIVQEKEMKTAKDALEYAIQKWREQT